MQSAFHPDAATMRLNNCAADIQAQASALDRTAAVASALKALKDLGLLAQRDTHALIANTHNHLIACSPAGDSNLRFARRIFDGIVEQILQDLFNALAVGYHRGQVRGQIQRDRRLGILHAQAFGYARNQRHEV